MFQIRLAIALLAALVFLPGSSVGREPQPEMAAALQNLREAQRNLQLGYARQGRPPGECGADYRPGHRRGRGGHSIRQPALIAAAHRIRPTLSISASTLRFSAT